MAKVPSPETEKALVRLRRIYGVKTNKELLKRSLELALDAAKVAKAMGIEPDMPTVH